MSLRPEIFGFDLARLRRLLGCGDESIVERAAAELERREHAEEAKDIAARAILTGVPFVGLDVEGDAHVTAAVTLLRMDQTLDEVGSHVWNMTPIWDLARLLPSLSRAGRPLRVFLDGRPLFGKQIKTGWSYYGFLDRAEVDELRRTVTAARDAIAARPETPPLAPEEAERLRNDLKAALEQISDDDGMRAFFARLVKEAVMLGDRPVKDLAFAAAKLRGGLTAPNVVPDYKAFLGRFNAARSRATPRRLLPFLAEFDGWLGRISGAGRDLFFFTA